MASFFFLEAIFHWEFQESSFFIGKQAFLRSFANCLNDRLNIPDFLIICSCHHILCALKFLLFMVKVPLVSKNISETAKNLLDRHYNYYLKISSF
jgi:hypothetical protein